MDQELIPESYDRHLNIFWSYNGKPHWEDNITKALINTLSMSEVKVQIEIIEYLLKEKITFQEKSINIKYDLQNPYIKNIKETKCKKYLVGLNPTGDIWSKELVSVFNKINFENFNIEKIDQDKYLKETLGDHYTEDKKDFFKDAIRARLNRGDSRPDAWIFIYNNTKLEIIVAIESKLWDLDPYQLNNHMNKSLGISNNKEFLHLHTFENICKEIKKQKPLKMSVQWHFLDYMEKLGYFINLEKFSRKDICYSLQNGDNYPLRKKWEKYLANYFISQEFKNKQNIYNVEQKEGKNELHFEQIGRLGNIYFDPIFNFNDKKDIDNEIFFIGTEIGVSSLWWNENISKIIKNDRFREEIIKKYKINNGYNSSFETFIRINCQSKTLYFGLDAHKNILDCLDRKESTKYLNKLSKNDCLNELKKYAEETLSISPNQFEEKILENSKKDDAHLIKMSKNIKRWKWGNDDSNSKYNILSYARLIDYIPMVTFENKTQNEFNMIFDELIERHIKGLLFIHTSINECLK